MAPSCAGISGSLGPFPRVAGDRSVDGGWPARLECWASFWRLVCIGVLLCCSQMEVLLLLPRPPARLGSLSISSSCVGDEESACYARDGIPADVPEPESSSCPQGWAHMRYLKPVVATATAGWWTPCVHRSSMTAMEKRRKSSAVARPRLKMAYCAHKVKGGLQCNFLFIRVVCAFVLGQLSWKVPVWCMRVCTLL